MKNNKKDTKSKLSYTCVCIKCGVPTSIKIKHIKGVICQKIYVSTCCGEPMSLLDTYSLTEC